MGIGKECRIRVKSTARPAVHCQWQPPKGGRGRGCAIYAFIKDNRSTELRRPARDAGLVPGWMRSYGQLRVPRYVSPGFILLSALFQYKFSHIIFTILYTYHLHWTPVPCVIIFYEVVLWFSAVNRKEFLISSVG